MKSSLAIQYAKTAAKAADDKQAVDILAFDVRKHGGIADIYMFMGATTHIHVRALEDAIRQALSGIQATLLRTDGQRGHLWRVLDYGCLLIHIMEEKTREFYSVERLWEQGKKVSLFKRIPAKAKPARKSRKK